MSPLNIAARRLATTDAAGTTVAQSLSQSGTATEKRMRSGKRLIFIGFVVAVLGIVAYCVVGLSAPARTGAVSGLGDFVGPSLGVIGVGTLLWLIGSVMFIGGAMDNGAKGPEGTY